MRKNVLISITAILLFFISCQQDRKVILFNGHDLTGWKWVLDSLEETAPQTTFVAENGILSISGQPFGYIRTIEKYSDYLLHMEWRWSGGKSVDNGIFNRLQDGDQIWPTGIQCQMTANDLGALMGGIKMSGANEERDGFFKKAATWKKSPEMPVGEWNTTEILCKEHKLKVTINGITVNETDCESTEGYIGMQSEGGAIQFRNIYIVKK